MIVRILLLSVIAAPAMAQDRPRAIDVTGVGLVRTPPDLALLEFEVHGEGETSDDAARALATRQKAVIAGVLGLLGGRTEVTTGSVAVGEEDADSRCKERRDEDEDRGRVRKPCFVATVRGNIKAAAIDKAATVTGLAVRLGARSARLQGFILSDPVAAQRRAMAAAIADARSQAEIAATDAKVQLGALLSLRVAGSYQSTQAIGMPPPVPTAPPPPSPPISIDVKARLIDTQASVSVTYAIDG